jgi:hypothetical protein
MRNTDAIRAIAELKHWFKHSLSSTDSMSATMTIFAESIRTDNESTDQHCITGMPINQQTTDKVTFLSKGFNNLKRLLILKARTLKITPGQSHH